MKSLIKNIYFRLKFRHKLQIGRNVNISKNSVFEGMNKIYNNSMFSGFMGFGSYIGQNCNLQSHIKIGRFSCIAPFVQINDGRHPYTEPFVTVNPAFYSLRKRNGSTFATSQMYQEFLLVDESYSIVIGSDCWIGQGAMLVGGITVGDGAVVLAHAVVTKDIPPYSIVGGIPAKVIKYRYDEETINFLLQNKWWGKDIDWLKKNWNLLCDMNAFKQYFGM